MGKLTAKRKLLAQHLAATNDLKQAARDAKYTYGSARNISRMPEFKEYVRQLQQESAERNAVTADALISEIAALAYSDITRVIAVPYDQLQNLPRHVRAAISDVRVQHYYDEDGRIYKTDCQVKMHSKGEAQRLLTHILDPKPSTPGGDASEWTGLTVNTLPPAQQRLNGSGGNGENH